MIYNAPYGNAAYSYFDSQSYGQLTYIPMSGTPVVGTAAPLASGGGTNPNGYGGVVWATAIGLFAEYPNATSYAPSYQLSNGTGYVMPYVFDVNNSGTFNVGDTFCKPSSFQIISAGQDGSFGTIVQPGTVSINGIEPAAIASRLYPTGLNYDPPPTAGGSGDDDNITNFCEKSSLDAAKP